jgi:hypothetical protein
MAESGFGIPLAQVIQNLRRELKASIAAAKDETLRFRLRPVELELEVELSATAGLNGGVKFWVVNIGGKAEGTSRGRHKIKLVLEPIGEDIDVAAHDERAQAGASKAGAANADLRSRGN